MRDLNKNQKGFSLIELLLVVSMIAFLATIALTSTVKARRGSRDAARMATTRNILNALASYYNDNNRFPCHFFAQSNTPEDGPTFLKPLWEKGYLNQKPQDPFVGKEEWSFLAYGTLKDKPGGPCGQIVFFEFTTEEPATCPQLAYNFPIAYSHGGVHCHIFYPGPLPAPCTDPLYLEVPTNCGPLADTGDDTEY